MTAIGLALGAHKRSHFPEAVLVNAYPESAPTQQEKPFALLARPGHSSFLTVGAAPLRGLFSKKGLFDDRALIIMAQTAYLVSAAGVVTTLTGTLPGFDLVEIDAGQDADLNSEAWVATGDALYRITEAGGVVLQSFPSAGGAGASSVCCHRQYVIASEAGTDQVFVLVPGDTVWKTLSFISAEYSPDKVKAVRSLGELILLLGEDTWEGWTLGGSASPPLEPYGGMVFNFGCRARATAVTLPGGVFWVDNECQVRLCVGGAPEIVSDHGLAEQIRKVDAADLRASGYARDGHSFYQLTLGSDATWVFDLTTKQWHRRNTLGDAYSRINLFAVLGDEVLAGNGVTNSLYRVDPDAYADAGEGFAVEFMAFLELPEGAVPVANLELVCETGDAPWNGAGSDPVIQMRFSDDGGKSWSRWRERPFGKAGQSTNRVRWNALGTAKGPHGRVFHFRVSDPVGRRFSDCRVNVS